MLDLPVRRFDRSRDDVAPIGDCGCPEDDHKLGAGGERFVQGLRERSGVVWHASLGDDARPGGRQALGGHAQGLLDDLVGKAGQHRRDDADAFDFIRRHSHQRLGVAGDAHRFIAGGATDREWNDLDGRDHLSGHNGRIGVKRRKGDIGVDFVETIDRRMIDDQHAAGFSEQIGAPGEGRVHSDALACHRRCDVARGGVFGYVAGFESRHRNRCNARLDQALDFRLAHKRALFEHKAILADRVHNDPALSICRRY